MEKKHLTQTMKRVVLMLIAVWAIESNPMLAKNDPNTPLQYEIKCAGSGQQGYYIVQVSAYVAKKKEINQELLRKCAVHGVLFRGFSGELGCVAQSAMLSPTDEKQHADFFNAFLANDYSVYASIVNGTLQTAKKGKGYELTATLQVAKEELRKTLQQAGIVRKLGF